MIQFHQCSRAVLPSQVVLLVDLARWLKLPEIDLGTKVLHRSGVSPLYVRSMTSLPWAVLYSKLDLQTFRSRRDASSLWSALAELECALHSKSIRIQRKLGVPTIPVTYTCFRESFNWTVSVSCKRRLSHQCHRRYCKAV